MATPTQSKSVIGLSPVSFASEDTGEQFHIPLSALTFDDKGAIDASDWIKKAKLGTKDKALVRRLLADLLNRGVLSKPPPA